MTARPRCQPLLDVLRDPRCMATLALRDWDLLLRQAAASGLLSRIAVTANALGLTPALPAAVQPHLTAARTLAAKQHQAVRWEVRRIAQALAEVDTPVVLLKGAAYATADLPPAAGRLFGDIDLLVPRDRLDEVEAALLLAGWHPLKQDPYDQRYYRQWMHELPPLRHIRRGTVLDVHHNLLPDTARIRTHAAPVLAAARPLDDPAGLSVPCTADLVLHSACHLFHEGEWHHGLRDLSDLDAMLRSFAKSDGFWPQLLARADVLNLGRPLYYALDCCRRWLHTPVPDDAFADCPQRPPRWQLPLMRRLFDAGLGSAHPSCGKRFAGLAAFALYVRSHYLRMPWRLLLPHLLHQATRRNPEQT